MKQEITAQGGVCRGSTGKSKALHENGASVGEQAGKVRWSRPRGRGNAEPGTVKLDRRRGVKWEQLEVSGAGGGCAE